MAKLQQTLVDPAEKATKAAGDHFERLRDRVRGIMSELLTERERLDLDYSNEMSALNDRRATRGIPADVLAEMRRRREAEYRTERNGLDAEGLTMRPIPRLGDLDADGSIKRLNDSFELMRKRIHDSREDFADAFSYGIESALRGDWRGLLESIVGSTFGDALKDLGRQLFDRRGGSGIDLGSIGRMAASAFGKLPGFKNGGSFRVAGNGGIDSSLVSFRATPGEMVDIRKPGADMGPAFATPMHFDLRGAVTTSDLLGQMEGMAAQSGGNALRGARVAVPADRAKSDRYKLGRGRR